jgi:predicted nucleic acid-binding protein
MRVLLDTNVILRSAEPAHSLHSVANDAIRKLHDRGDEPVIVPQIIYEFWVVATRPLDQNGLGFDAIACQGEVLKIESLFGVLDDTHAMLAAWKSPVIEYQVLGKSAHDARLVAAMNVHGLRELLTFDKADFLRYSGITVRSPQEVITA